MGADLLLLIALTASWPLAAWWAWRERCALVASVAAQGDGDGLALDGWPPGAHAAPSVPVSARGTASGSAGSQTSMHVPAPGALTTRRLPPSPSAR